MIIIVYVHFTGDYINPYVNIGLPVFAYSVSVFLALINLKLKLKEKSAKRITALSNLTFGVYIIHAIILTVLTTLFPYSKYCVLYILVCFVAVVLISFFISYIFSKVPLLKKAIKA